MADKSPAKPLFGSARRKPEGRCAAVQLSASELAEKVVGAADAALSASPRSIASLGTHCEEARQQSISEQLQRHTSTI